MPRGCGCAGNSCSCMVIGGAGVDVTGTGNASSPFVVSLNDQSGFVQLDPTLFPGNLVDLTGLVAGDIVVHIESEVNFTLRLPSDAPRGLHVELTLFQPAVVTTTMTLTATDMILFPGGTDPVFNTLHAWARFTRTGSEFSPYWMAEPLINMAV